MRRPESDKRVERAEQPIELSLPSCLGYEKVAMDTVALVAERMGFRPEQIAGLRTAVAEAVTNAIEHGNCGIAQAAVRVMITTADHGLIICVRDQCYRRFNRSYGHEQPDLARAFSGEDVGLGMWLIRQFVDEVEWTGSPRHGNEVRMVLRCR